MRAFPGRRDPATTTIDFGIRGRRCAERAALACRARWPTSAPYRDKLHRTWCLTVGVRHEDHDAVDAVVAVIRGD